MSIIYSYKAIISFVMVCLGLILLLHDYLTLEAVFNKIEILQLVVDQSKFIAALIFIVAYILTVTFSIPVASILTVLSGYLFGSLIGGLIAFIGALIGATILFLIFRLGLNLNFIEKLKSSTVFSDLSLNIYQNQFRYLLILRFFPMFPFWAVNLAPAILGVRFRIFFFTSFIGILPGTFVIASIGERLRVFSEPSAELVHDLMSKPSFILPFIVLSLILFLSTVLKISYFKKNK